jgi:hypothetical protein
MQEILVAILSNPYTVQGISALVLAGVAYALRKVPAAYLSDRARVEATHVIEGLVADVQPLAEAYKTANGGKLTPEQVAELNTQVIARAENTLQARGIQLGKVFAPEALNWAIKQAVEKVKGVERLPAGTAGMLPSITALVGLSLLGMGCMTFPDGWQSARPERVQAVQDALAGGLHSDLLDGTAHAAATAYRDARSGGADREQAARTATRAAVVWYSDHADGRNVSEVLRNSLTVSDNTTDAEVLLGLLRWGLTQAGAA